MPFFEKSFLKLNIEVGGWRFQCPDTYSMETFVFINVQFLKELANWSSGTYYVVLQGKLNWRY